MYNNRTDPPKPNAPCRGCPDRHMACHAECSKYQEWNAERQAILAIKSKEREVNDGIVRMNYETRNRTTKHRHSRRKTF